MSKVTLNAPFGKQSLRYIKEDLLRCWPTQSEVFNAYLDYASKELTCPPQFHVATLLTMASTVLLLRGVKVVNGPNLSLWVTLVGDSATGKSTAMDMGLDFLREGWEMNDVNFPQGRTPIIQGTNSTVQGLIVALHRHYDQRRGTTVGLIFANQLAQLFRQRDPLYPCLNDLADGKTHTQEKREHQRRHGQQRNMDVPDQLINPRVCAIFDTTVEALAEIMNNAALSSGFLRRTLIVFGEEDADYVDQYIAGYYEAERLLAQDIWAQWLVRLNIEVPGLVLTYSDEVINMARDLTREAARAKDLNLKWLKDMALKIAGLFALLCCQATVTAGHYRLAYRYVQTLLYGKQLIEQSIGASETAKMADKLEAMLIRVGEEGITRSVLSRKMKVSKQTLDDVIDVLEDREAITQGIRETKSGPYATMYFLPKHAPDDLKHAQDKVTTKHGMFTKNKNNLKIIK
jgi:hypothetical protein